MGLDGPLLIDVKFSSPSPSNADPLKLQFYLTTFNFLKPQDHMLGQLPIMTLDHALGR